MKKRSDNLSEGLSAFRLPPSALKVIALSLWLVGVIFFIACEREKREFRQAPPSVRVNVVAQSDLQPGSITPPAPTKNPAEESAVAQRCCAHPRRSHEGSRVRADDSRQPTAFDRDGQISGAVYGSVTGQKALAYREAHIAGSAGSRPCKRPCTLSRIRGNIS